MATSSLPTTAALTQELFQLRKRIDTLRFRISRAKRMASNKSTSVDASVPSSPLATYSTLSTAAPRTSVSSLRRPAVPTAEKRSVEELEARLEGLKRTHRNLKHIRTLLFNAAMARSQQQQPQPIETTAPAPTPAPAASVVQNEAIAQPIENNNNNNTEIVQPADTMTATTTTAITIENNNNNQVNNDTSPLNVPELLQEAPSAANVLEDGSSPVVSTNNDTQATNSLSSLEIEVSSSSSASSSTSEHQRLRHRPLSLSAPSPSSSSSSSTARKEGEGGARSPQRRSKSALSMSALQHQTTTKPFSNTTTTQTTQCGCGGGGVVGYVISQAASRFSNPVVDLAQAAMAIYCFARSLLLPM